MGRPFSIPGTASIGANYWHALAIRVVRDTALSHPSSVREISIASWYEFKYNNGQ